MIFKIVMGILIITLIVGLIDPKKVWDGKGKPPTRKELLIGAGVAMVIVIIVNFMFSGDSDETEKPALTESQKIEMQKEKAAKENIFIAMDVVDNLEQANAVKGVLDSVGVTGIKSVTYNKTKSDDATGIRAFTIETDAHHDVDLFINPNKTVAEIKMGEFELYQNGNIIEKFDDFVVTSDEQLKYQAKSEEVVRKVLKAPSTAKFYGLRHYDMDKLHGILTVSSYVDAQNSFGAMIRSTFIIQYDTKDNGKVIHFTFDDQVIF